jgi:DNA polymerase III subunit epsilon
MTTPASSLRKGANTPKGATTARRSAPSAPDRARAKKARWSPEWDLDEPGRLLTPFVAFVACGTTGLDPDCHELIELAVVRARADDFRLCDMDVLFITPERPESADPNVLAANGYDAEVWRKYARPLRSALRQATLWLDCPTLVGHDVAFEARFLQAAYRQADLPPPRSHQRLLDIASLGWPLRAEGALTPPSLDELADALGVPRDPRIRSTEGKRNGSPTFARVLFLHQMAAQLLRRCRARRTRIRTVTERAGASNNTPARPSALAPTHGSPPFSFPPSTGDSMTLLDPVRLPDEQPLLPSPPTPPRPTWRAEAPSLPMNDAILLPVADDVLTRANDLTVVAVPPAPPSTLDAPPSGRATPSRDDEGEPPDSLPGAFLAFVDCETTGLDPDKHEIVEIAVVRADARTLAVLDERTVKVRPERLDEADPDALLVCGYDPDAWRDAVPLAEALAVVTPMLEGATLAGHHVVFDRAFLHAAYRRTGLRPPTQPRHLLDTASLGWPLYAQGLLPSLSLDELAGCAGAARPFPHRALDDARCARAVAAHLLRGAALVALADVLSPDEHDLAELLLRRMATGHFAFGPGGTHRDYLSESMVGLVDAMQCLGAEVLRLRRSPDGHPYAPAHISPDAAMGHGT